MRLPSLLRPTHALLLALAVASCGGGVAGPDGGDDGSGDGGVTPITDAQVFALARATEGWTWYKLSADTLSPGSNSPHGRFRTRYNARAAALLDAQGKVRAGASFPDSSLIVKEVYQGGALALTAVMLKARTDPNARSDGWLWAEYRPDGLVAFSVRQGSGICTGCHLPGIDFTRMNDSHP